LLVLLVLILVVGFGDAMTKDMLWPMFLSRQTLEENPDD